MLAKISTVVSYSQQPNACIPGEGSKLVYMLPGKKNMVLTSPFGVTLACFKWVRPVSFQVVSAGANRNQIFALQIKSIKVPAHVNYTRDSHVDPGSEATVDSLAKKHGVSDAVSVLLFLVTLATTDFYYMEFFTSMKLENGYGE